MKAYEDLFTPEELAQDLLDAELCYERLDNEYYKQQTESEEDEQIN